MRLRALHSRPDLLFVTREEYLAGSVLYTCAIWLRSAPSFKTRCFSLKQTDSHNVYFGYLKAANLRLGRNPLGPTPICERCSILAIDNVTKDQLMELRVKDLRQYLESKRIPTAGQSMESGGDMALRRGARYGSQSYPPACI